MAALDTRTWRVVGKPLVAARGAGVLDGETVAVKDLFDVAGYAVGAGNPAYLGEARAAETDADAVRALLDAGAAIRGIAQTDEFAYSIMGANAHYGTPPNPSAPDRLPGGSSSGPASAVALGEASIGLGTDTAGSIRVPASWQGLWGLRSTHGAVSRRGLLPLAPSFDAVGWLTRTPDVLARVVEATIGSGGPASAGGEFVVCPELLELADSGVREAFAEQVGRLSPAPREVRLPDVLSAFAPFRVVQAAEAWGTHGAWLSEHPGVLGPDVADRFALAGKVTADDERDARLKLADARSQVDAALGTSILLLPTTPTPAPLRTASPEALDAMRAATIALTRLAASIGRPALSVPVLRVDDAPAGLSLLGPRGSDADLIARAAALFTAE